MRPFDPRKYSKNEASITVHMSDGACEYLWTGPADGEVWISDELGSDFITAMPWDLVKVSIAPEFNGGIYKRREYVSPKSPPRPSPSQINLSG